MLRVISNLTLRQRKRSKCLEQCRKIDVKSADSAGGWFFLRMAAATHKIGSEAEPHEEAALDGSRFNNTHPEQ